MYTLSRWGRNVSMSRSPAVNNNPLRTILDRRRELPQQNTDARDALTSPWESSIAAGRHQALREDWASVVYCSEKDPGHAYTQGVDDADPHDRPTSEWIASNNGCETPASTARGNRFEQTHPIGRRLRHHAPRPALRPRGRTPAIAPPRCGLHGAGRDRAENRCDWRPHGHPPSPRPLPEAGQEATGPEITHWRCGPRGPLRPRTAGVRIRADPGKALAQRPVRGNHALGRRCLRRHACNSVHHRQSSGRSLKASPGAS